MNQPHVDYLYSLNRYDIKPGLERIEALMEAMGHPEKKFQSIHISGTNGKGSVAAMVESVLRTAGIKTGLYTSPDIYSFNERIRVGGKQIPDEELADIIWNIKDIAEKEGIPASFFEFGTAAAYEYFARQQVEVAVVEVGMGGLMDATNVITPMLSVITNIGLDHQEFLGDTKEKIAVEKAGIIKPGVPVVIGEKDPVILAILGRTAKEKSSSYYEAKDIVSVELIESSCEGQKVKLNGKLSCELFLPLLGKHQLENAQTAIASLITIQDKIPGFSAGVVSKGIASTVWEGRLDIIQKDPLIIVDGAHNADGVAALTEFMESVPQKDVVIFGAKKDRDIAPFLPLLQMFRKVIVTKGNYLPEDPAVLATRIPHPNIEMQEHIADAVQEAKKLQGGTLLITGSLYLVADALAVLRRHELSSR